MLSHNSNKQEYTLNDEVHGLFFVLEMSKFD